MLKTLSDILDTIFCSLLDSGRKRERIHKNEELGDHERREAREVMKEGRNGRQNVVHYFSTLFFSRLILSSLVVSISPSSRTRGFSCLLNFSRRTNNIFSFITNFPFFLIFPALLCFPLFLLHILLTRLSFSHCLSWSTRVLPSPASRTAWGQNNGLPVN